MGVSLYRLSLVAWASGGLSRTQIFSEEALSIFRELGYKEGIADTLLVLAEIYLTRQL